MQCPAVGVVPRLIEPEGREVDPLDGRGLELVQVRGLECPEPGAVLADFRHHHGRALLSAGVCLDQAKEPAEFLVMVTEVTGLELLFGRAAQPGNRRVIAQRTSQQQPGRVGANRGLGVSPAQGVGRRVIDRGR